MYKYKITVFTPTYNRGYILRNLYNSLKRQTYLDFEWVVIDDGSTDNTEALFNIWMNENNKFNITYKKVDNGGKHRAINEGVDLAKGKLFFIVDSDDYLVNNALEKVVNWAVSIENEESFAGIAGNRGKNTSEVIGNTFSGKYIDATSLERNKNNIIGDKAEVFYTEILREYRFPEFEGEKFVTEKVVWNQIAYDGYKIRWFNEIIYICDYLDDGLTKSMNKIELENPKSYALALRLDSVHYKLSVKKKIQLWFDYYIIFRNRLSTKEMSENLELNYLYLMLIINSWKLKNQLRSLLK